MQTDASYLILNMRCVNFLGAAKLVFHFYLDLRKVAVTYHLSIRDPYSAREISRIILYTFIFVSGTIGNGLVIRSFMRASHKSGSRFVIGLAVFDFIASMLVPFNNVIIIIYDYKHWPLGYVGCMMIKPWMSCPSHASAWMLLVISLERAR